MDEIKRYISVSFGVFLSNFLLIPLCAKVGLDIPIIYLLGLILATIVINKYRKKSTKFWKAHLVLNCVTATIVMGKIMKTLLERTEYLVGTLTIITCMVFVLSFGVFFLGLYITDRYYD